MRQTSWWSCAFVHPLWWRHSAAAMTMKEHQGGKGSCGPWVVSLAVALCGVAILTQTTDWPTLIGAAKPAAVWILAVTSKGTSAGSGAIVSPVWLCPHGGPRGRRRQGTEEHRCFCRSYRPV